MVTKNNPIDIIPSKSSKEEIQYSRLFKSLVGIFQSISPKLTWVGWVVEVIKFQSPAWFHRTATNLAKYGFIAHTHPKRASQKCGNG